MIPRSNPLVTFHAIRYFLLFQSLTNSKTLISTLRILSWNQERAARKHPAERFKKRSEITMDDPIVVVIPS